MHMHNPTDRTNPTQPTAADLQPTDPDTPAQCGRVLPLIQYYALRGSVDSFKKTLCLMNNCPEDLLLSVFLSSLMNELFGLGCGLLSFFFFNLRVFTKEQLQQEE